MSSNTPLGRFCGQLKSLCDVLLMLYPEDTYFKKAETYLDMAMKMNPRMCHSLFVEHMTKFKQEIMDSNDVFFIEYCEDAEKRQELKQNPLAKQYNIQNDLIDTLLQRCAIYWKQLEEDQKKSIWKYLKVLLVLSERV